MLAGFAVLAPEAGAARRVSASFGVLGARTVHATATTSGVPGGERIVLEGRRGSREGAAVRATGRVRRSVARLRWAYPAGRGALHLRVRVIRGQGARARTLAVSPWRTLRTGGLRRAAPLAAVRPGDVVTAPTPGRRGELVLRGTAPVHAGDVIALPVGRATPDGLLARAREVRRAGDTTVVATSPATLPDVMPVGDLTVAARAEEPPPLQAGTGVARLLRPLTCGGGFAATIAGRASMSAGFSLRVSWRTSTSLERPNVTADLRADVRAALDAGISVAGASSCVFEPLALYATPLRLRRVSTSIGPLPVTVTADGQVFLSAKASTLGRMAVAAGGATRGTVRTTYDGIAPRTRGTLRTRFRPHDSAVAASGGAQAGLAPTVQLRLFGLAGPRVDIGTGAVTTADVVRRAPEPWWSTAVLDELGATFALQALRPDLQETRVRLTDDNRIVARTSRPAGGSAATGTTPSPDPLPAGVRARVLWDSGADVQLHAFAPGGAHLFSRAPRAISGAKLVPSTGETPPVAGLQDDGSAPPLTLGLCLADGTEANVALDVREPSGETVRHALTLRGTRAAALVTTTPVGAAPAVPAAGWCGREGGDPSVLGELTTGELPVARARGRAFGVGALRP